VISPYFRPPDAFDLRRVLFILFRSQCPEDQDGPLDSLGLHHEALEATTTGQQHFTFSHRSEHLILASLLFFL